MWDISSLINHIKAAALLNLMFPELSSFGVFWVHSEVKFADEIIVSRESKHLG